MAVKQDGVPSGRSTIEYLAVLGNEHRRIVVGILVAKDHSVSLSSLAEEVTAEMRGREQDIDRVKVKLHHNHLPKLDDAGVLEYYPDDHRVVPTDDLKTVERLAESVAAK